MGRILPLSGFVGGVGDLQALEQSAHRRNLQLELFHALGKLGVGAGGATPVWRTCYRGHSGMAHATPAPCGAWPDADTPATTRHDAGF